MITYALNGPCGPWSFLAPDRALAFLVLGTIGREFSASAMPPATEADDVPANVSPALACEVLGIASVAMHDLHPLMDRRAEEIATALESLCFGDRAGFDALALPQRAAQNFSRGPGEYVRLHGRTVASAARRNAARLGMDAMARGARMGGPDHVR